MVKIGKNLNASQDMQKSNSDKDKVFRDFKVGEHVFLKVKTKRGSIILLNKLLSLMSKVSKYSNTNVTLINTKVEKLCGSGVYIKVE
jgi:hypothetical protein